MSKAKPAAAKAKPAAATLESIESKKEELGITASNDDIKALAAQIVEAEKEADFTAYRKQLRANRFLGQPQKDKK